MTDIIYTYNKALS